MENYKPVDKRYEDSRITQRGNSEKSREETLKGYGFNPKDFTPVTPRDLASLTI